MPLALLTTGELGTPESTAKLNAAIEAVNEGGLGSELAGRVEDLETVVGDETAGLVKNLADLDAGKYEKPAEGIPGTDLAVDARSSLARADTALQGSAAVTALRTGRVALNGANPTPVAFQGDGRAELTGTEEGPFALDDGLTLVVNPDAAGDDTVTFEAAAGTSVSGAGASEDISAETDNKLMVSVDGNAPQEIELTLAGLNSGAAIAAAIQGAIQALGGAFAAVTCAFAGTQYTVTSGTKGTGSAVEISNAPAGSIAEELKLGTVNGGTETPGTGDAANIGAATAEEVAAAITTKATLWAAEAAGNLVRIYSSTTGSPSSLVVNAASTADLVLGITGSAYGPTGLGYESDMADADYVVMAVLEGVAAASLAGKTLSVTSKTTTGFNVECETTSATDVVALLVAGLSASS